MPGATHFGSYEKSDLFNFVLEEFFSKPYSNDLRLIIAAKISSI